MPVINTAVTTEGATMISIKKSVGTPHTNDDRIIIVATMIAANPIEVAAVASLFL
jgi:hypothetical protein